MPRKADTKVEETQVTPQTEPQEAPETTEEKVEDTKVEETQGAKVYNFTSVNPYLSCAGLGIQFIEGKASTSNLAVARALAGLDGVELVED